MEISALIGSLLGFAAIIGGQWLEGGSLGQIFHFTALLIVLGGTAAATLLSFPTQDIVRALGAIPDIYLSSSSNLRNLVDEILRLALSVRKEGLVSIEGKKAEIQSEHLKKATRFLSEGIEASQLRELMEVDAEQAFEDDESAARVFEGAGGYAPTIGILGAVLGLIQVLSKLEDPSKIGEGIAVAFVATIYGVGLANLVLLPWASRLRRQAELKQVEREAVKLGIIGILEGENPLYLKERLEVLLEESQRRASPKKSRATAEQKEGA